ncbi:MAG: hypothetical protein B7Z44_19580 [Caulobacter sp. 12-67-6]|nr:MAG: hypothetical protein B7Z44_19580 [Caulobacter sp. 12-67-6]
MTGEGSSISRILRVSGPPACRLRRARTGTSRERREPISIRRPFLVTRPASDNHIILIPEIRFACRIIGATLASTKETQFKARPEDISARHFPHLGDLEPGQQGLALAMPNTSTTPLAKGAWYTLVILTLVYVSNSIDRTAMSILIEPVKAEFKLSDSQLGLLTGLAFGLTYALTGLPMGWLIDRVNRTRLLATVVAVWSLCTAICGFAQNYPALVMARLAVGASESAAAPTAFTFATGAASGVGVLPQADRASSRAGAAKASDFR